MKRTVELIFPAKESFLPGDFVVRRALPRRELRRVGGFVFLDHFDQANVTPAMFDVPPHPHIGLQTVTYLFEGEILHTDSLGNQCKIEPGDVNWMTAGRGITHAEQVFETQPRVHGLQSWVGLPHAKRKIEPEFAHFPKEELPRILDENVEISVIAGQLEDSRSQIPTFQDLVYLDVSARAGAAHGISVDAAYELAIYVCEGKIEVDGTTLSRFDLAKLSFGDRIEFNTDRVSRFVVVGGEPLPDPTVIYWNFIADTIEEAKMAMADWELGKFPPVRKYRKFGNGYDEFEKEKMQLL